MRPLFHMELFDECLTHRSNGNVRPDTIDTKRIRLADAENQPEWRCCSSVFGIRPRRQSN